jgi:hypothetical protein
MCIAIVGLLSGISGAARNAARLREHDRAVQLARLRMNELLVDDRMPRDVEVSGAFAPEVSGGIASGWRARRSIYKLPPAPVPGGFALDRIELEVWWTSGAQRRTFTLDGYRRRILKQEDMPPPEAQ